jgi:hypothetical protein
MLHGSQVLESCRLRSWVAKQWALTQKSVSPTLSPSGGSDTILSRNPTSTVPSTTAGPVASATSPPPPPHSPPTLRTVSVAGMTPGGGTQSPSVPSATASTGSATSATAAAAAATNAAAVAAKAQIDNLKKDNRLYLRIVNEKQAKILQLENALTTLQRDVIVRGTTPPHHPFPNSRV